MITCIGCGENDGGPSNARTRVGIAWVRADERLRIGVCSFCRRFVERWDMHDRRYEAAIAPELHAARVRKCGSCTAPIVWFPTQSGKNMPVDFGSVVPSDSHLQLPRHISHFATCPDAAKHRRPR